MVYAKNQTFYGKRIELQCIWYRCKMIVSMVKGVKLQNIHIGEEANRGWVFKNKLLLANTDVEGRKGIAQHDPKPEATSE